MPDAVSAYFHVSNGSNVERFAQCFAADAVVTDEGRTHRGLEAIQSWQQEAQKKFTFTVEPIGVSRDGDWLTVTALVTGNFPGSPVRLDHVFGLTGDRIKSLEIR